MNRAENHAGQLNPLKVDHVKARVIVDGKEVRELNAWFDPTWDGYRQL